MMAMHTSNAYRLTATEALVGTWPAAPAKGLTINVTYPAEPEVGDYANGSFAASDINTPQVPLTINHELGVHYTLTGREQDFQLEDFQKYVIDPAIIALSKQVELQVMAQAGSVYNASVVGANAYLTTRAQIEPHMTNLDNNGALFPRYSLLSYADYNRAAMAADFSHANITGDSTGSVFQTGKLLNAGDFEMYKTFGVSGSKAPLSPNLVTTNKFTAGDYDNTTVLVNGAVLAGATTMNTDGGTINGTLKAGDLFTVAGVDGTFLVTADNVADGAGAATGITFTPAAPTGGFPDDAAVTFSGNHAKSLFFSRGCIVSLTLPPMIPEGQSGAQVRNPDGFSFTWFAHNRGQNDGKHGYSFVTYLATKCIRPEWGSLHLSDG